MKKIPTLILIFLSTTSLSAQSSTGYLKNKGATIFYEIMGSGSPVIFLHGGPGLNHTYMMPYFNELGRNNKLVFFDQRACGRSAVDIEKKDVTLQLMVDDIDALRKMLNVNEVAIVAHSFGCLVAVKYAEEYASHVSSLTLIAPVPLSKQYEQASQALGRQNTDTAYIKKVDSIMHSPSFKAGNAKAYEALYKESFRPVFHNKKLSEKFSITMQADFATDRLKLFNLGPELANYNYYDKLSSIQKPVLIVSGKYDLIPVEAQLRIRDSLKKSEWLVMEQSGHFPFIEQHDELIMKMGKFINPL